MKTKLLRFAICSAALALDASALPTEMTCRSFGAPRPNDPQGPEKAGKSVYACKNYDWVGPCFLWDLVNSENGYWTLWGASHGPGPWEDFNYTIGSWGPSQGVSTIWFDEQGIAGLVITHPGTSHVADEWKGHITTWCPWW